MELTIKHLAPYLPYGLKVFNSYTDRVETLEGLYLSLKEASLYGTIETICDDYGYAEFKPILKKMRNLTSEDIVKLKAFVESDKQYIISSPLSCGYDDIEYLLANHYDVFGLIDLGLAIEKH